jgi:plasmid stabilization system protein ParE
MRTYRFAPAAADALERQIDYLLDRHAKQAARRLEQRVQYFIENTLCRFPDTGTFIADRQVYESWIPSTKIVVWYTVTDTEVIIAMIWNTSQGRLGET